MIAIASRGEKTKGRVSGPSSIYWLQAVAYRQSSSQLAPLPLCGMRSRNAYAELTAAIHAASCRLGERELRHLELVIAPQRWCR